MLGSGEVRLLRYGKLSSGKAGNGEKRLAWLVTLRICMERSGRPGKVQCGLAR